MRLCPTCQRCFDDEILSCPRQGHAPLIQKRAGTLLINNRYRLDELLGHGGMGAVYNCTHLDLNRSMAIKLLRPDSAEADPYGRQRLRREALTACRFNHPNLVQVYDSGTNVVVVEDGEGTHKYDELYVVMELLEGQTLREYLQQVGPLSVSQAVMIARQLASGLTEVHSKGVVHRDLKPANIMLTRDYKGDLLVKIVDFGAVKFVRSNSALDDVDLTGAMMIGSARYTSPENCRGEPLDERSDIYCLGLILYEMVSGRHPFKSRGRADLIHQHAYVDPPSLNEVCLGVPEKLVRLVMNSLAKYPEARPQSAAEFAEVLMDLESPDDAWQSGRVLKPSNNDAKEVDADEETRLAQTLVGGQPSVRGSISKSPSGENIPVFHPVLEDGLPSEFSNTDEQLGIREIVTAAPEGASPDESALGVEAINQTSATSGEARRIALGVFYFVAFLTAAAFFAWSFLSRGPTAVGAADGPAREISSAVANLSNANDLVTTTDVNIRDEPSLQSQIIGLAERGSRVRVLSKSGNWREVHVVEHGRQKVDENSEDQGWVDGGLLRQREE